MLVGGTWHDTAQAACKWDVMGVPTTPVLVGILGPGQDQYRCQRNSDGLIYPNPLMTTEMICASGTLAGNQCVGALSCPSGYTLNGNMCDPLPNECKVKEGQAHNAVYYWEWIEEFKDENAEVGDIVCVEQCAVEVLFSGPPYTVRAFATGAAVGMSHVEHSVSGVFTGDTCDMANATSKKRPGDEAPPTGSEVPVKAPPCGPTEGVLTSSSGKVACVPAGVPDATKPKVEEKERKEKYPDGSEKNIKETKTTDPKTGATNTTTTTTSTGGMAGPAGESESSEDEKPKKEGGDGDGDGNCEGDDCGDGDGPEFTPPEGGDLYEKGDRTIRQAWDEFVSRITNAALPASMTNFFNISGVPASCGGMSINVPMLDIMISLDEYICGETGQFLMYIARIVIAAMAAWLAFRIAFQ